MDNSSVIFGRKYKLTVTTSGGEQLTYIPPMQVVFSVMNKPNNQVAIAAITIYGVSIENREKMQEYRKDTLHFGTLQLIAGYHNYHGEIFSGDINNVEVGKDGPSTYIKLYCMSNVKEWESATTNYTWGPNTPFAEILRDIALTFGFKEVEFIGNFADIGSTMRSHTIGAKPSREMLNEWRNLWRYDWWIEADKKVVIKRQGAARSGEIIQISAKNGMEGSPRFYMSGMEVDIRLDHRIMPGDMINVTSDFWKISHSSMYQSSLQNIPRQRIREGKFSVLSTAHEGNFYHNTWKTTLACQFPRD